MTEYYFVGTILPELKLGQALPITFRNLMQLLEDNLTKKDFHQVSVLRRYYDLENLREFWKEGVLDRRGTLDKKEIEEALLLDEFFPAYVRDYLETYDKLELRLANFSELITAYYREEVSLAKGFLKTYLLFERKLRLFQVTYRALKLNRSLQKELRFENPEDELIKSLLEITGETLHLHQLPMEFEALKMIFDENGNFPLKLYQSLSVFRFNSIEQLIGDDLYSIDRILGYVVQFIIIQKWNELNQQAGMDKIDTYIPVYTGSTSK